ncbi:unnamed protein product [Agarophyton chilense]
MNLEHPQSSHYVAHQTQQHRQAEHPYPSTWTSSHTPQRYESAQPAAPALPVVTMNVYAIPFAYTVNNEPLFLQFGSHFAAEAAQSASYLRQRYWQMKTQPATREDYAYSAAAVSRPARAFDQMQASATDRYQHYESGSVPRPQPTFEYQYSTGNAEGRAREHNTIVPRSVGNEMNPQPPPLPQRVHREPEVARSVVPDIPPVQSISAKDGIKNHHVNSAMHPTHVNSNVNYETEDRCSDRSGRGLGVAANVLKEQSAHHESNDVRDSSHHPMSIPNVSHPNDVTVKTSNFSESDKPSRSRGSKRFSDGHSNDTEGRSSKRSRLHWTQELHASFLAAVEKLGIGKAVPTSIIREMGVEGLTRENVASHLQKHRTSLKKAEDEAEKKELVETLKIFIQSDPNNPRKGMSDEDVLKEAAARQRLRRNEKETTLKDSVQAIAPHAPKHHTQGTERQEPPKAQKRGNR